MFLEPVEWDELQGSSPVIQLDVSVKHYIGESATGGRIAVERSRLPCMPSFPTLSAIFFTYHLCIIGTVHWSVSKSTLDADAVCRNVTGARNRATYPLFLPRGVALPQMEEFWHALQFNPVEPVKVPFKAELFHSPPTRIKRLRYWARQGRWRLERSIRKQEGRPKKVLGIPNDVQKVAPLLDLARGPLVQTGSRSNSTEHKHRRRKGRPVGSSSTRSSKASENRERTTRKAKNPQRAAPVWGCSRPSWTTEQTKHIPPSPRTKGDHARFGGVSLPDGPVKGTREYLCPPYIHPRVAIAKDDEAHSKKRKYLRNDKIDRVGPVRDPNGECSANEWGTAPDATH